MNANERRDVVECWYGAGGGSDTFHQNTIKDCGFVYTSGLDKKL